MSLYRALEDQYACIYIRSKIDHAAVGPNKTNISTKKQISFLIPLAVLQFQKFTRSNQHNITSDTNQAQYFCVYFGSKRCTFKNMTTKISLQYTFVLAYLR